MMNEDLAKDYLRKSGFDIMQADALSKLLAETVTKDDLRHLGRDLAQKIDGLETRLRAEILSATADLRSELNQSISQTRTDLSTSVSQTRADLSESIAQTRADLSESIAQTRADLTRAIADVQTQTMRWGIAMIIAMSSIFTLLDIFID